MKRRILPLLCLCLSACGEVSKNGPAATTQVTGADSTPVNEITFRVNGEEVKTTAWNIARFQFYNMASPGLNITSNMHEEKRTVRFNLAGYHPGTYTLDGSPLDGGSYGSYMPDYWERGATFPITNGSVTLTEVDTIRKIVNGTFSFTSVDREGDTITVTDGHIRNGILNLDISGISK